MHLFMNTTNLHFIKFESEASLLFDSISDTIQVSLYIFNLKRLKLFLKPTQSATFFKLSFKKNLVFSLNLLLTFE